MPARRLSSIRVSCSRMSGWRWPTSSSVSTDAAIAEFEKATQPLREVAPGWQGLLAHALARAGRRGEADMILADLRHWAERRHVDSVLHAAAHVGLDQPDEAMNCLERAADDRSALLVVGYPVLDPLRSHARFARLMARVGLPPDPLGAARAGSVSNGKGDAWLKDT